MRIAYITAGAGGMFCGSCLRDNTLVATLIAQGHDALLVPTYTPIHTDEPDVSQNRIFFGGINVYLEQYIPLFRHTPRLIDRLFNSRGLLRWAGRFAAKTRAEDLGDLTVSMLKGDDIFLEALPQESRERALQLIRDHCREIDGFIATSLYYADFMAEYLSIPRDKIHVVYPGLNLAGHGQLSGGRQPPERPLTIGYFARICPEKGLHILADAFQMLKTMPDAPPCRLRVSGWLGDNHRPFFNDIQLRMNECGLADSFEYVESPDH